MAQQKNIFSEEALEKLRTPEKLDAMLPITTPIGWMALTAIGALMVSVVLWSIFGSFTSTVSGMGMIMDSDGVERVSHGASGKIAAVYVQTGDHVRRGDRLAHLEEAERTADTRMAQYGMSLAGSDREAMERAYLFGVKRYQQQAAEDIYSNFDGVVDEIMVERGMVVGPGTPICTLRRTEGRDDLTGVLFIPVGKGKRVEPGMTIQLAPNGVDTSQSGSLLGVVRSISQYPVSLQSIEQETANSHLAHWIAESQKSALMEVKFDLVKDESSPSGYLWTSTVGKHRPITAGSFCTGQIVIERKPPIEKVFYKLSQWLRNR